MRSPQIPALEKTYILREVNLLMVVWVLAKVPLLVQIQYLQNELTQNIKRIL